MKAYDEILASFVNRNIIINSIPIVFCIVILFLIWFFPLIKKFYQNKTKTKKKKQESKKEKIKQLILAILVTVVILPICCFVSEDLVEQHKNMKNDIENQSYVTYTGKYELKYKYEFIIRRISDIFIDLREVELEGNEELLLLDMSKVNEGLVNDYGIYEGTIVYAEKSGYVLYTDAKRVGDEW